MRSGRRRKTAVGRIQVNTGVGQLHHCSQARGGRVAMLYTAANTVPCAGLPVCPSAVLADALLRRPASQPSVPAAAYPLFNPPAPAPTP